MTCKKILVVAAHPDDEVLGVGGTLIKHQLQDDEIYCLILGEGALSRAGGRKEDLEKLRKEAKEAGAVMGFKEMFFSDFPDNSFDTVALLEITREIEKYLTMIKPDRIYAHYENDLNVDHRIAFQATLTACRPCNPDCPSELYAFETPSCTEWQTKDTKQFSPNLYVNVESVIDKKIEALKKYTSEIRQYPHPRSAEGVKILAQYRGLESGMRFAEGFCLIRKIKK